MFTKGWCNKKGWIEILKDLFNFLPIFILLVFPTFCLHNFFSIRLLKVPRKKKAYPNEFSDKTPNRDGLGKYEAFFLLFHCRLVGNFPTGNNGSAGRFFVPAAALAAACIRLLYRFLSRLPFQGALQWKKKNEIRCTSKKIVMIAIFQNEMARKIIAKNIVIAPFIFSNFMKMNCIFLKYLCRSLQVWNGKNDFFLKKKRCTAVVAITLLSIFSFCIRV